MKNLCGAFVVRILGQRVWYNEIVRKIIHNERTISVMCKFGIDYNGDGEISREEEYLAYKSIFDYVHADNGEEESEYNDDEEIDDFGDDFDEDDFGDDFGEEFDVGFNSGFDGGFGGDF